MDETARRRLWQLVASTVRTFAVGNLPPALCMPAMQAMDMLAEERHLMPAIDAVKRCLAGLKRRRRAADPEPDPSETDPASPDADAVESSVEIIADHKAPGGVDMYDAIIALLMKMDLLPHAKCYDGAKFQPPRDTPFEARVPGTDLSVRGRWKTVTSSPQGAGGGPRTDSVYRVAVSSPTMPVSRIKAWIQGVTAEYVRLSKSAPDRQLMIEWKFRSDGRYAGRPGMEVTVRGYTSRTPFESVFFRDRDAVAAALARNAERGTPTGITVFGRPGMGKTSFLKALMHMLAPLGFHVCLIDLDAASEDDIKDAMFGDTVYDAETAKSLHVPCDKRVLVFDEADRYRALRRRFPDEPGGGGDDRDGGDGGGGGGREEEPPRSRVPSAVSAGALLSATDGIVPRACWLVLMTNHVDRLDEAFLRAGRFGDFVVDLDSMDVAERVDMFTYFAGRAPTASELPDIEACRNGADVKQLAARCELRPADARRVRRRA